MNEMHEWSEVVEAEGHLIDSEVLTTIFDKVIEQVAHSATRNL